MNLNELKEKAHANAVEHGFWTQRWSIEHCLMLVMTEVGELVEAHRSGREADMDAFVKYDGRVGFDEIFERYIKDTVADEFADVAIRLLDLAGHLGLDFDRMHPCRYHRAFDHFPFTENAYALCKGLARDAISVERRIQFGIEFVLNWAISLSIGLPWHIDAKMKYNENRPIRHNKKY